MTRPMGVPSPSVRPLRVPGVCLAVAVIMLVVGWSSPLRMALAVVALLLAFALVTREWSLWRSVTKWKAHLESLRGHILGAMGWERFVDVRVPYAPDGLNFVASTGQGFIELLCLFENEVAVRVVKAPTGFELNEKTWPRWIAFEREDLVAALELRLGAPLQWRHVELRRDVELYVSIRPPSVEEGVNYLSGLLKTHFPDIQVEIRV